jgi:hypothetical protein
MKAPVTTKIEFLQDAEWFDVSYDDVLAFVPQNEDELICIQSFLCHQKHFDSDDWKKAITSVIRLRRLRQIMMTNHSYREPLVPGSGMQRQP